MSKLVTVNPISQAQNYVSFSELGKKIAPYLRTYHYPGAFINENHEYYFRCQLGYQGILSCIDIGIDGYLKSCDALKIYELAYFSSGDILELGTFKGLSTSIIAQAICDAKLAVRFETVDIDAETNQVAQKNVQLRTGGDKVSFYLSDATEYMDKAIVDGKRYSFIFIDHWHGYEATYAAAMRAKKLLNAGGFCLFHDYNDSANSDPNSIYGVYKAAHDAMLCDPQFDFYGTFGCTALFRKHI